jgi:hypothetical protein
MSDWHESAAFARGNAQGLLLNWSGQFDMQVATIHVTILIYRNTRHKILKIFLILKYSDNNE